MPPKFRDMRVNGDQIQPVLIMNEAQGAIDRSATCGTISSAGNNTILAAPGAGLRYVIWDLTLQNEAATAQTITLRDFAARVRYFTTTTQAGLNLSKSYPFGLRLNENAALTLNLSAATAAGYSIVYSIETVE